MKLEFALSASLAGEWITISECGEALVNLSIEEVRLLLPELIELTGYGRADATAMARTGEQYDN